MEVLVIGLVIAAALAFASVKNVKADDRVVIERLGRPLPEPKGPGIVVVIPFIDRLRPVSMARQALEVPQVDVITGDDRTVRVDLAITFRVLDPVKALYDVSDYRNGLAELTRTAVRAVAVERTPSDNSVDRAAVAGLVRSKIEPLVRPWGLGIEKVDVTAVQPL